MSQIENIKVPEFEEFLRVPENPFCVQIDSTRLLVEILGGLQSASSEFSQSEYSSKITLEGNYSLVIRYKREKDGNYYPVCILSFDINEEGNVFVNNFQGSKDRHVAFRVHSSLNITAFYLKLVEESFLKRGIPVYVKNFPEGIENASHSSKAITSYNLLRTGLIGLNNKYGLS